MPAPSTVKLSTTSATVSRTSATAGTRLFMPFSIARPGHSVAAYEASEQSQPGHM